MSELHARRNRRIIWAVAAVLFLLHHDFWFWNDRTLVFGFLPIGLAYHLLYSCAAGALWFAMMKFAWPEEIERFASGENPRPTGEDQGQ